MNPESIKAFQKYVYHYFDHYGRHDLPWRKTFDPYQVMVSEIMLQQTQVERVIPKFENFLAHFPDIAALAQAPVSQVTLAWQGLGYNRRGLNLQRAAQKIVSDFNGKVPSKLEDLLSLPGIGPYTAAAIQAFAFNLPSIVIETNIRTLFIFHFFHGAYNIEDKELITYIEATLDRENPRKWYSALMDYGSYLKQVLPNPSRQSKTYVKQSKLAGSNREARGKLLKLIAQHQPVTKNELMTLAKVDLERFEKALTQLQEEGFIQHSQDIFRLV